MKVLVITLFALRLMGQDSGLGISSGTVTRAITDGTFTACIDRLGNLVACGTSEDPRDAKVFQKLKSHKTINAQGIAILPLTDPSLAGFMLAIATTHTQATHAIVEAFYFETTTVGASKPVRLMRHKSVTVSLFGQAMSLSDPLPVSLDAVEFVRIRLVRDIGQSEFWNYDDAAQAEEKKKQ